MKVKIECWEANHREVYIEAPRTLAVIKVAGAACIYLRSTACLNVTEAKTTAKALELAAKVAGYLDELMPSDAYDMIAGLPTTPYDGPWPTPRAGRTENP